MEEIILCDKCKGCGRYWEREQPAPWRKPSDGIALDETGNAMLPGSKLVTCKKCNGTGKLRISTE